MDIKNIITNIAICLTKFLQIIMSTALIIVAVVAGCYEVIARAIPTVNNWSGTAIILRVLTAISDFLNNKKA